MGRKPTGTGASFVPRDAVQNPYAFAELWDWLEPAAGADQRHVRVAQLQHFAMVLVKDYAVRSRTSMRQIADHLGMSVDKLYRMKRGETLLPLADLLSIAQLSPSIGAQLGALLMQPGPPVPGDRFLLPSPPPS